MPIIHGHNVMDNPADYGVEVKPSTIHGLGLFAAKDMPANHVVAPFKYRKENVMSYREFKARFGNSRQYSYSNRRRWQMIWVDPNDRNVVSFTNYADPPNCALKAYKLVTLQPITAGTELTLVYPHYDPRTPAQPYQEQQKLA